jgi:hypothetical protein
VATPAAVAQYPSYTDIALLSCAVAVGPHPVLTHPNNVELAIGFKSALQKHSFMYFSGHPIRYGIQTMHDWTQVT